MKCTKCNHALPDDSEFCQYCGNRIEKTAVMLEVDATIVVDEVTTASDVPVKNDVEASAGGEAPKQSSEEVILPLPEFENMEPDEAPKPILGVHAQETIGTMNANCQSQAGHESEMDFGFVPKKARKAKKVKQPKKKYCSRCGALIDLQSKKCTGCGKRYAKGIRFNKFAVRIMVFLVITALIGLNVFQYLNNSRINEELKKKHDEITDLNGEILDFRRKVADLETTVNSQRTALNYNNETMELLESQNEMYYAFVRFCNEYVAVIGDDGTNIYHRYGCKKLDTSNGFWILNTDAAEDEGYLKCPHCH